MIGGARLRNISVFTVMPSSVVQKAPLLIYVEWCLLMTLPKIQTAFFFSEFLESFKRSKRSTD